MPYLNLDIFKNFGYVKFFYYLIIPATDYVSLLEK